MFDSCCEALDYDVVLVMETDVCNQWFAPCLFPLRSTSLDWDSDTPTSLTVFLTWLDDVKLFFLPMEIIMSDLKSNNFGF